MENQVSAVSNKKNIALLIIAGLIARGVWSLISTPLSDGTVLSWLTLALSALAAAFFLRQFNMMNYGFIAAFGCVLARYIIHLVNLPSSKFVQWLIFILIFPATFILMWWLFNALRLRLRYKITIATFAIVLCAFVVSPLIWGAVIQQEINRGLLP